MSRRVSRPGRLLATAALLVLLVPGRAGATPLLSGAPDITTSFLNCAFDTAGGVCGAGSAYTHGAIDPATPRPLILYSVLVGPECAVASAAAPAISRPLEMRLS